MTESNHETSQDAQAFLDTYVKPLHRTSKFWVWLILLAILATMGLFFKTCVVDSSWKAGELTAALEFFSIDSQWVERPKTLFDKGNERVVVPQISFRLRNLGKRPLKYLRLLGIFRYEATGAVFGEDNQMVLKQTLEPGQESAPITLRSPMGYAVKSLQDLEAQRQNWLGAMVVIHGQARNSQMIELKTFYISRRIQGVDLDVRVQDLVAPPKGKKDE